MSSQKEPNTLIISIWMEGNVLKRGTIVELDGASNQLYRRFKKKQGADPTTTIEQLFIRGDILVPYEPDDGYHDDYVFYSQLIDKAALNPNAKDLKLAFNSIRNYQLIICYNGKISYHNKACSVAPLPGDTEGAPEDKVATVDNNLDNDTVCSWLTHH